MNTHPKETGTKDNTARIGSQVLEEHQKLKAHPIPTPQREIGEF